MKGQRQQNVDGDDDVLYYILVEGMIVWHRTNTRAQRTTFTMKIDNRFLSHNRQQATREMELLAMTMAYVFRAKFFGQVETL